MKFTSRDLINKFLENMDTQKGKSLDIAVSNIFYDKDVLDDENIIFADDSEAYNALEELAQVQKGNDGIFSVINVARKVMKANAEDENFKEIHDKLESLLANQDDPRLDRALGYRLVSIEK
ncbi:hypothetical protein L2635_08115 [Lactobacillus crispatus]|uniref:hypothetical protein n=1 Tax=Lactobacillus crispatus TaxID=47770 RepID=UPI00205F2124|nr:hypothetical protein [Lactobacillus crispatus]MCZ3785658.1 hypothetical protein [Lactobacillus crispatus]MCZ3793275.1 hypothetical protein [Lactobacillus crispatus]DAR73318.1 MAG TPA: hypothetical protein [Caudoviricetes sp.]